MRYVFICMLAIFFIPVTGLALTITPMPYGKPYILTACPFNLTQLLWYDVCGTPATGLKVYYNISNTTLVEGMEPQQMFYPLGQTLAWKSDGIYENSSVRYEYPGIDYFWRHGSYTAFTKAVDTLYLTYDRKNFYIYPDFPFFFSFSLSGSPAYLNVKWNGSYNITPGSCMPDRPLSLTCYFNNEFIEEIDPSVKFLPKKEHISTISFPNYQYCKDVICPDENCNAQDSCSSYASNFNLLSCNSFDPDHPWLNYWNYINFRPIHFEASRTAPPTVTLGEEFKIKIDVSNHGLFVDNYTIEVISTNPSVISVIDGQGKIENLAADCPKDTFPTTNYLCSPTSASFEARVIPLVAGSAQLIITVRSDISGVTLRLLPISVTSSAKSLSEFDWLGIVEIMGVAAIILIFFKKHL